MNGYIVNFAVYTMAMIGFVVMALYIYKKAKYTTSDLKNKNFLQVESLLKLSPVKSIYVIKAGKERFLIAGDSANTTMLAKLVEDNTISEEIKTTNVMNFTAIKDTIKKINRG